MRFILLVLLGLIFIPVSVQNLSNREIKNLAKLDLEYSNQKQNDFIDELTGEIISESNWQKLKERTLVK